MTFSVLASVGVVFDFLPLMAFFLRLHIVVVGVFNPVPKFWA